VLSDVESTSWTPQYRLCKIWIARYSVTRNRHEYLWDKQFNFRKS